jgi:hypothetical protein
MVIGDAYNSDEASSEADSSDEEEDGITEDFIKDMIEKKSMTGKRDSSSKPVRATPQELASTVNRTPKRKIDAQAAKSSKVKSSGKKKRP